MEIAAILQADLLDIVFEGRNKEYGAYELRRTYNKRVQISVAVMLSLILLFGLGHLIAGNLPESQPHNHPFTIINLLWTKILS